MRLYIHNTLTLPTPLIQILSFHGFFLSLPPMKYSMEQVKDYTNDNNSSTSCCNTTTTNSIAKRKRTKRPRLPHPLPASATTSSASSADFSSAITEEDEDVANCLMLLSRGRRISPALPAEAQQAYECKTCNKSFPSFQALGGHRASHKKPKTPFAAEDGGIQLRMSCCLVPTGDGGIKSRAHECSICGLEFSSGQALGGHMRRHRQSTAGGVESPEIIKNQRSSPLLLDLNLPAPLADIIDHPAVGFTFSSLVDCQYY